MSNETYINLQYSEENIRQMVLSHICRILIRRGYMDFDKYKHKGHVTSTYDEIDNNLFKSFIGTRSDNGVYQIPLDVPYKDQRTKNNENENEFVGSTVVVKIIHHNAKDISHIQLLNDFLKTYPNYHKIIVFDDMSDKVDNALRKKKNIESFTENYLMIDLMSHDGAPLSCEIVKEEDFASHIINPKFAKIFETDPLCRYYNCKKNDYIRIVRSSLNNSCEVAYRKVI